MASVTFLGSAAEPANTTTPSFTSQPLGTPSASRIIYVAVGGRSGSSITVNGVTLGGVAMTQVIRHNDGASGAFGCAGIYRLAVPTGTTATIQVTFSAGSSRTHIGIWATEDVEATPVDKDLSSSPTGGTGARSVTLDSVVGGFAIGALTEANASLTSTWTGITEDFDIPYETTGHGSGAHGDTTATSTTITATPSASSSVPILLAVTLAPTLTAGSAAFSGSGSLGSSAAPIPGPPLIPTVVADRNTAPVMLVVTGSSTPKGSNATTTAKQFWNILSANIRAANPQTDAPTPNFETYAAWSAYGAMPNGLHFVNMAGSGLQSNNWLPSTPTSQIIAMAPKMIAIMVGSNDWADDVAPATYKSNIVAKLATLRAGIPGVRFLLLNSHQRGDSAVSGALYSWTDYGAKLAEIAAESPSDVDYVDPNPTFVALGVPTPDAGNYLDSDNIHLRDNGHAVLAQYVTTQLNVNGAAADTGLDGSGQLAVTRLVSIPVGAALSGSGGLGVIVTPAIARAIALSGSGQLAAAATVATGGSAALGGSGSLSVAGSPSVPRAAALSGAGALATGSAPTLTASLGGTGTLTIAATTSIARPAPLTGAGTLAVTTLPATSRAAAFSGAGSLSTTAAPTHTRSVALAGAGTLTASAAAPALAPFQGAGQLTVPTPPTEPVYSDPEMTIVIPYRVFTLEV